MSFRFAVPWNFWLFLSLALVLSFAVAVRRMSATQYRAARPLMLVLIAAAMIAYGYFNIGGFYVFGGPKHPFVRFFFIVPVVSPLVLLVCLVSMRWAALLTWGLFLWMESFYLWANWPHIYGMLMTVSFNWPILAAASALSVIAWQDKVRRANKTDWVIV